MATTPRKRKEISGEGLDSAPSPTKRPLTDLAPNVPIRSWVTHTDNTSTAEVDGLSADKRLMQQLLKAYRDSLDTDAPTATTRNFNIQERARVVGTMASLYMPETEKHWAIWKDMLETVPHLLVPERYTLHMAPFIEKLIATWKQARLPDRERSGVGRTQAATDAQRELHKRTNSICYLTGNNWGCDSCHTLPNSIERHHTSPFWLALGLFWSAKDVLDLQQYVENPETAEGNLLMLDAALHRAWNAGRLVFKPLETTTANRVDLEVHLLSNVSPGQVQHIQVTDPTHAEYMTPIYNGRTGRVIKTGDIIHIESIDSTLYPLPCTRLLKLQYHMQRVLRAAAAAEGLRSIFGPNPRSPTAGAAVLAQSDVQQERDMLDTDENSTARPLDPDFCEFLLSEAVRQGIIRQHSTQAWRAILYAGEDDDTECTDSFQG